MACETIKDVLDHVREFHVKLSGYYNALVNEPQKERVQMLLKYMSRHETQLAEGLSQYQAGVSKGILEAWFKFPPPKDIMCCSRNVTLDIKPDLTVDEVIAIALKLDACLVHLYEEMIKCASNDDIKSLFANLLANEKREELKFVRDALRLKEL